MSVITYRLDLVILLVDTTTGQVVEERDTVFYKNDRLLSPEHREEGLYILVNEGREDFELRAEVFGYETYYGHVCYETLDSHKPEWPIYLMPKESLLKGERVLSYRDRVSDLEAIEAIILWGARCAASKYHAKKQELTVFRMDGSRNLPDVHYGLLQGQKNTYTHIEVAEDISDTVVRLAKPLEEEFSVNAPIYRVIFGMVEKDGAFLLRVRDVANEIPVIIRYRKKGEWYSFQAEFHSLMPGAAEKAQKETKGDR